MSVLWFSDDRALDAAAVGYKAAHLAALWRAGFTVPDGFVVPVDAYGSAMARDGLDQTVRAIFESIDEDDESAVRRAALDAQRLVLDLGPGAAVDEAIRAAYRKLGTDAAGRPVAVAVRSSSDVEDLAEASGAGLQDSVLWVRGEDEVVHQVVRCWAGLYGERSVDYRVARGVAAADAAMAVLVQRMVLPVAAGVALTVDPITGDRGRVVIDSAFGLGEAVVSGIVTPDHFVVDKQRSEIVRRIISTKEREVIVVDDHLGQRVLDARRANEPSLDDDLVLAVASLALRVEQHFGCPQDIEWAVSCSPDAPTVHLLQARPETVASRRGDSSGPEHSALDGVVATLRRSSPPGPRVPAVLQPPNPFDVSAAPGAVGWEEMYPASMRFDPSQPADASKFWFRDGVHWPRPVAPWDATILQFALTSLSQFNTRHFQIPAAKGVEARIVGGYCYLSPVEVEDPDEVDRRSVEFRERAGYYYEHWDDLYAVWMDKIRATIGRLGLVTFSGLEPASSRSEVFSGRALGPPYDLQRAYHELLDSALELWQFHFEFLNLGYAAYLDFFEFCRGAVPDVDELTVARMVAGLDVDLFRPDRELRRLARSAVDRGIASIVCAGSVGEALRCLPHDDRVSGWWAEYTAVHDPWFNYSNGSGFAHDDAVWVDRPEIPLGHLRSYIEQLLAGETIETPTEQIAHERDTITADFAERLSDAERATFDVKLSLARTVFHFVENHNFYVEHWGMSLVWRKMRELSAVFIDCGWWSEPDDIFLLRRDEVFEALWDMVSGWAVGRDRSGSARWADVIAHRRGLLAACGAWTPPPVLGLAPKLVNEPFTVMLWGITAESIQAMLAGADDADELTGFAASPGVAVGRARVVAHPDQLVELEPGEVLVTTLTSPSWAPAFRRLAATVTDTGGIMSHAAIVCREYGLPAVTGTGFATQRIRTGQLLEVDGTTGRVRWLEVVPQRPKVDEEEADPWIS